jgi:hypothetical protein
MKKLAGFCGAWRHRSPLGLPRGGGSAGSRLRWDGKRAGRKTKSAFLTWSPIPAWNLAARDGAAEESCLSAYPHHHHDFHVAAFRRSELDPRRPCKGNPKTMARSEPIMALSRRSKTQLIVRTQYLLVLRFTRYDLNRPTCLPVAGLRWRATKSSVRSAGRGRLGVCPPTVWFSP